MDWAFDHHTCFYRSGYDLSLPLKPKILFPQFASTPATNRKLFLTFKVRHGTAGRVLGGIAERYAFFALTGDRSDDA